MSDLSRIVILGHTGFIGRHLLVSLRQQFASLPVTGISTAQADLTDLAQSQRLREYLDESTALIDCAAIQKWVRDDLDAFDRNLRILCNVLRVIEKQPVRHLVYFSSAAVYGEGVTNLNIIEETPHAPTSYYGIAKSVAEQLLSMALPDRPTPKLTLLRPSLVYGEDTPSEFYLPAGFAVRALEGKAVRVWGDGEELRDYIHVDDVCALVGRIVSAGIAGTFNLASGEAVSYRDVLCLVAKAVGREIVIESIPRTRPKVSLVMRNERLIATCEGHRFVGLVEAVRTIVEAKRARVGA